MHGVEAARVTPAKMAKMSAAVIDVFRSRNNSHNADLFFATLTNAKNDLDPATQIFTRRILQARRTCNKKEGADVDFRRVLKKYAAKHKDNGAWPTWYRPPQDDQESQNHTYPPEQPHPSTKEHDPHWSKDLTPVGPVGLLCESILWHGMTIDDQIRIWQKGEPPLDILKTPCQNLKFLSMQAATRARTRAEWTRSTGNPMTGDCREIDREISQISSKLSEEEKGVVRTKMIGRRYG